MSDLATSAGLAARWGVSRAWVDRLAEREGFPSPELIDTGGRPIRAFPVADADQWKSENRREQK